MLVANEKPTGTSYTTSVALLIVGFLLIPAVLIVSRPVGYLSSSVGFVCSAICIGLARMNWMKSSRLSMASIAYQRTDIK